MSEYNYRGFLLDMDQEGFARFPGHLKVGRTAPDGELTDAADGRRSPLSAYWRSGPLVIEVGSIT